MAKDDENYTYNTHVSRVAPIQEGGMIRKAIAAGVSEERIAKALNLTTQTIRRNARRLKGICPDAVEILKDKPISEVALAVLRKVKPYRQIENGRSDGAHRPLYVVVRSHLARAHT